MTNTTLDVWESAFASNELIWGTGPAHAASFAADYFAKSGATDVLIPGIGYGRNAGPFRERGMSVTGIEISATAIALARSRLGLDVPIHHGSVVDMPYDAREYDGIFCHALLYLLDGQQREKLLCDCTRQLRPGGHMIFTVLSKTAPMYARGRRLGDDWYETSPGIRIFFYDPESIERELGPFGLVEVSEGVEAAAGGGTFPFFTVICRKAG